MVTSNRERAIGVFSSRQDAEQALDELKASGFSMEQVSIIAKNADEGEQIGGAQVSDRVGNQNVESATAVVGDAVTSATWGTVLVGLTSLAIPGLGVVIAAGSAGVALVTAVAGAGIGAVASANLVRALTDLGIPEAQARTYGDRLHQGNYLLLVDGTSDDMRRAEAIFSNRGIQDWSGYNFPNS